MLHAATSWAPLVIRGCRRVHPRTHKRVIATLDNGLARAAHEVEQVVDVVHGEQDAAEHLLLRDHVANVGAGVNSGFIVPPPTQFVPFVFLHFQYSQPTTFFKVPARQSINIGQTLGFGTGYGWDWTDFTIPMIFLSEDIAIAHGKNWYFSTGVGVGLQAQQNERLGAKLLFQFKLAGGYRINDKWGIELFVQHFSNANTAPENNSYAFYGTGFTYSF